MVTYRGWQMNPRDTVSSNVTQALQNYMDKMGTPPQILECADGIKLPEDLQLVVKRVNLPNNILLVGVISDEI